MLATTVLAAVLSWGPIPAPADATVVEIAGATGTSQCSGGLGVWLPGTLQVDDPTRASERADPPPQRQRAPTTDDCALA